MNSRLTEIRDRWNKVDNPFVKDATFRDWYKEDVAELLVLSSTLADAAVKAGAK